MILTASRLPLRPCSVIFSSMLVILAGCAAQSPIETQGKPVSNSQGVTLAQPAAQVDTPVTPISAVKLDSLAPRVLDAADENPTLLQPVLKNDDIKVQVNKVLVDNSMALDSVVFLLGEAGWAFSNDKLTTPKAENAYYFLTQVLDQDPNNKQALDALDKIVQRYYELLLSSLKKGKVEQARVFWSRAKKVNPQHQKLSAMKGLIDDYLAREKNLNSSCTGHKKGNLNRGRAYY